MRFLVTGGAGFLGSGLANQLAKDGHQVLVLDDLSNGKTADLHPAITFVEGDVDNIPLLWSLLQDIDCVYHLAARVSVAQSILYPRDYNRVNVGGTVSLMEAMRDTGVRRVVFASSGAIYGAQTEQPIDEQATPKPDSPYAVSKWAAEQYINTIGGLWGLETVALRIFNAYGPRQSLPTSHPPIVPYMLQQILSGGSVVLFGNGEQTRDFVYLSDVVAALRAAGTVRQANRQVINIGSGVETSISELVTLVEQVTGKKGNRLVNEQRSGGVQRLGADVSQAQKLLGFRPLVSLAEGLERLLREDGRFQPNKAA